MTFDPTKQLQALRKALEASILQDFDCKDSFETLLLEALRYQGFVLVPVEPSKEMVEAICEHYCTKDACDTCGICMDLFNGNDDGPDSARDAYRAMIEASDG